MVDIVILLELFTRVKIKDERDETVKDFENMVAIYSFISFLFNPKTPNDTPVINSLFQQRTCMENVLRAIRGLQIVK